MPAFPVNFKLFGGDPPDILRMPPAERPLGWREKALAGLPALSREAFYIRNQPFSTAERESRKRDLDAIERQYEGLPPLEEEEEPTAARSALDEFCFDIAAECAVVCAALERPHELDGTGLRHIHFYDRALAELFRLCDYLHVKEGVARPFNLIPERLDWASWWRREWEGEGRHIFMAILESDWDADAKEAAATVIELAQARGIA